MPFDRRRYPADWPAISARVRADSGGRCECRGECGRDHAETNAGLIARSDLPLPGLERDAGRCASLVGWCNPATGSRVVLTVAHLWRGPCAPCHAVGRKCAEPSHLKAMCQACHLAYDLPQHIANARRTRRGRKAAGDLFDPPASGV